MKVPDDHLYTWTFSRKSLIIRFYLWVYEAPHDSVTFCKLFWGMVCSPLTLPVRLFVGVARLLRMGLHAIALCIDKIISPGLDQAKGVRDEIRERREAKAAAIKLALRQRKEEEQLCELICFMLGLPQPPPRWTGDPKKVAKHIANQAREAARFEEERLRKEEKERLDAEEKARIEAERLERERLAALMPKRVPVTERIAAAVALRVDKMVAWWQAHPQIGITTDVVCTKIGRFFVRGVFYPAMVAVPLGVFSFLGYLGWEHRSGFTGVGHGFGHATLVVLDVIWKPALLFLAAFIGFILFMTAVLWLSWKASAIQPTGNYDVGPVQDLRLWKGRDRSGTPSKMGLIYKQGWDHLSDKGGLAFDRVFKNAETGAVRAYRVLTPVGHVISASIDGVGWGLCMVGKGVRLSYRALIFTLVSIVTTFLAIIQLLVRSMQSTSKFFVIGHHAVKYRTCPRIRITAEDE